MKLSIDDIKLLQQIDEYSVTNFPDSDQLNQIIIRGIRDYWDQLGDIPINEDEEIEEKYLHFSIGTDRQDIWHWLEDTFNISIGNDLLFLKEEKH